MAHFGVAYVVVLVSLIAQGWAVPAVARSLDVNLPPLPEAPRRVDIDLPMASGEDIAVYTVQERSPVVERTPAQLRLPAGADIISVMRDGVVHQPAALGELAPGDQVLVMTRPEQLLALDHLFGVRETQRGRRSALGQFALEASVPIGAVADFYDLPIDPQERDLPLGEYLRRRLAHAPGAGDRVRLGNVELVVQEHDASTVTRVGIDLAPRARPFHPVGALRSAWRALAAMAGLRRRTRR